MAAARVEWADASAYGERFARKVAQYLSELEDYQSAFYPYARWVRRGFLLRLENGNDRGSPATDIDLTATWCPRPDSS